MNDVNISGVSHALINLRLARGREIHFEYATDAFSFGTYRHKVQIPKCEIVSRCQVEETRERESECLDGEFHSATSEKQPRVI